MDIRGIQSTSSLGGGGGGGGSGGGGGGEEERAMRGERVETEAVSCLTISAIKDHSSGHCGSLLGKAAVFLLSLAEAGSCCTITVVKREYFEAAGAAAAADDDDDDDDVDVDVDNVLVRGLSERNAQVCDMRGFVQREDGGLRRCERE